MDGCFPADFLPICAGRFPFSGLPLNRFSRLRV
jgi:hypothetical protein